MNKHRSSCYRWIAILIVLALIAVAFVFRHSLSLEYISQHLADWSRYRARHPYLAILWFSVIYIFLTAVSFPAAHLLTLAGGALFGVWLGTVIVSVSSTIGATLAFWLARWVFRQTLEVRYSEKLKAIREGVAENEIVYLLALRLNPVIPFWLINLLMGLTTINSWRYFWVSQIGMIPGTFVFVNAGEKLSKLTSIRGILTPPLLISLLVLAVFPPIAKLLVTRLRRYYSLSERSRR